MLECGFAITGVVVDELFPKPSDPAGSPAKPVAFRVLSDCFQERVNCEFDTFQVYRRPMVLWVWIDSRHPLSRHATVAISVAFALADMG